MIGMVGVIACNWLILIAQYQLRRNSKSTVNVYVASLSASAIIFACIFAPTVFTAYFQTMAPTYVCLAIPYIQLVCVSSTAFCLVAVAADLYVMVVRATGPAQLHGGPNHQSSPASWRFESTIQPSFMAIRTTSPAQLHGGRTRKAAINLLFVWLAAVIYSSRIFIDLLKPEAGGDFNVKTDDEGHHQSHAGEKEDDDDDDDEEECILFIETDLDDLIGRAVDLVLLYVLPIALQIFFYIKVARKLWSSQVSQPRLFSHATCSTTFQIQKIMFLKFGAHPATACELLLISRSVIVNNVVVGDENFYLFIYLY